MVYRRVQKAKRSYRPRKSMNLVKTVKAIVNKNIENKYQSYDITTFASANGTLTAVNVLGQGTGVNNRVGNRVKFTSVRFNGYWAAQDTTNIVRIMVMWSRAPLDLTNMPAVWQPINPGIQNYRLLYDRTMKLEAGLSSGQLNQVLGRTVYRKINGNSTYDNNTTTPDAGFLYFYFISDSALTAHPLFTGQAILSYQDA